MADTPVRRLYFTCSLELTLGEEVEFEVVNTADIEFEPDRFTTTAPTPDFVVLTAVRLDGVDVLERDADAFSFSAFNPDHVGPSIAPDARKLAGPTRPTVIIGRYTGHVPPDMPAGAKVPFAVRFSGFHPETLKKIRLD